MSGQREFVNMERGGGDEHRGFVNMGGVARHQRICKQKSTTNSNCIHEKKFLIMIIMILNG